MEAGEMWALGISAGSLIVALVALARTARLDRRASRAAHAVELFKSLRLVRDHAFEFGKPLGGGQADDLIALHYAIIDVHDLKFAVHRELRRAIEALLEMDAVGVAMSIDPARFHHIAMVDEAYGDFLQLATRADELVQRTQAMRRGVAG